VVGGAGEVRTVGMKLGEASVGMEIDRSGPSTVGHSVAEEEDGDSRQCSSRSSPAWLTEEDLRAAATTAGGASARSTSVASDGRKRWTASAVERHVMGNGARIFSLARRWRVLRVLTFETEVTGVVGRRASG
jgi:hypothetical protein